jgi:membrane-bound serine protease (ClpP class)
MDGWQITLIVIGVIVFAAIAIIFSIKAYHLRIHAGVEELVGRAAEVKVALKPKGMVFIDDERWTAVSESGPIEEGEQAVVTRVDGMVLYVKKK